MKTATTQRYNRETRMVVSSNKRIVLSKSGSRSRSKDNGSISKRNFKSENTNKSPAQEPANFHRVTNNVIVYPARNESVKRMFKNMNRNKTKLVSIRKQINISDSKPSAQEVNKSSERNDSSITVRKNFKLTNKGNHTMKLNQQSKEELLDAILFQKPKNVGQELNRTDKHNVSQSKCKKEPKTKIEMIKSSENKGDVSVSSDYLAKDNSNSRICDSLYENSRRVSADEEASTLVPKIEISLNECLSKQKSLENHKSLQKDFSDPASFTIAKPRASLKTPKERKLS